MIAIVPERGQSPDYSVLRSFRNLAVCGRVGNGSRPGHTDGWGIVTWKEGEPIYLGREPTDAFSDPLYETACLKGEIEKLSSPVIAHLRKASMGIKIKENTHPFTNSEWAFAHNGTIRKLNLKFTTDSQWFFESIMDEYRKNGREMVSAISKLVQKVREIYPYTSITFLMSNGKIVYGYRDCANNEGYYSLFYAKTQKSFLISQEQIVDAPWIALENGALLTVDEDFSFDVQQIVPKLEARAV